MANGIGKILTHLRDGGPTSRADLARATGLSSAGVTKICATLSDAKLLHEAAGKEPALGRPATEVSIRADGGYVLSIHLSPAQARVAVCNLDSKVLADDALSYDPSTPVATIVDKAADLARQVIASSAIPYGSLLGLGVGVPGSVDEDGRVNTHSVLAGWRDVPFAQMFEAALGLPTVIAHNASAIAMAEARYGAWKASESLLYILLGKGIGAGFVKTGAHERTSIVEIGHVVVNPGGPHCRCGGHGCLERYFSEDPLRGCIGQTDVPHEALISAAMDTSDWPQIYEYFLQALSTTVTLLGPEMIVLGGDLNTAPDAFVEALRADLPARVMPQQRTKLAIERTSLPAPVGVHGAACVALERFFFAHGPATLSRPSKAATRA